MTAVNIRIVATPEEADQAAALIGAVLTIVEDSGPRARRGGGALIQRYLDVRLPQPEPPPAPPPRRPAPARPQPGPSGSHHGEAVDLRRWS